MNFCPRGRAPSINRCAVFNRHVGRDDTRKMILKDSRGMADADRDDRTAGFCGDLERSSWNGSSSVSEAFLFRVPSGKIMMEMPDLDIINGGQDGLQTGFKSVRSRNRQ